MNRILIIGGVAGGATAAAKLRRLSKDTQITILESGPDISFANCGLPYYIGGDIDSRSKLILQSPVSFHDQYNVQVDIETEAIHIDRDARIVTAHHKPTNTTVTYPYDALILAQGGRPIIPPLPGADGGHVFSLWTLGDMDAIQNYIEENSPRSAVVVGGGFIGIEMVEALRKRGLDVAVVERMPYVMPNLTPEISGFLQQELAAYEVAIYSSKAVTEITDTKVLLDDGTSVDADMVIMSVGVRPTLDLATTAGLAIGEAGGLLVDTFLRSSDENIFGIGDMIELEHKISGKKVRIPLAGPANRQGRLAAGNAMGEMKEYHGSQGTSVVRVFEAVAGSTGLSLEQARQAGFSADAVTIHKEHHTSYFPGSTNVTVHLVYDRDTGIILGGQTAGFSGADKRLDIIATAAAGKMTIHDIAELDFAYSPPIGTANDAANMAAFAAENRNSGFSPSITAGELDEHVDNTSPFIIDLRDVFAFEAAHVTGSHHIPLPHLPNRIDELPTDRPLMVYCENGKKGHQALRYLVQAGYSDVTNVSGGFTSLERHTRAAGFRNIQVGLIKVEPKSLSAESEKNETQAFKPGAAEPERLNGSTPLIIDVRTPEECATGMAPDAVNIPLDDLPDKADGFGDRDREITVYCATGARSAYGARVLNQLGFANVRNGGGITDMMVTAR